MIADVVAGGMLLASGAMFLMRRAGDVQYVRARADGNVYLVRRAPDAQEAAEAMAELDRRAESLIRDLQRRHPDDPRIARLRARYNREVLSEGGEEAGYTSFSVDKESIVLCLREKADKDKTGGLGELEPVNTLFYVLLHELAHLAVDEVGHTERFWGTFSFMVDAAAGIGLYDIVDYRKKPAHYCGIKITSAVSMRAEEA